MELNEVQLKVRLSEVDSFGVVWHGRYVTYFEVGRTALLERFGLSAAQLREGGYFPAIVHLQCEMISPARDEQILRVRTRPEPSETAKLILSYEISREEGAIVARGVTTQVLLDSRGVLLYRFPPDVQEKVDLLHGSFE